MNKKTKTLLQRVKELEEQVALLKNRPMGIYIPVPYYPQIIIERHIIPAPYIPNYPYLTWQFGQINCQASDNAVRTY